MLRPLTAAVLTLTVSSAGQTPAPRTHRLECTPATVAYASMGVAPLPELGRVSSNPPGKHAGNLDNRELVAGSTLYIPVFVSGALFEIGDGHAAQGGEVDQTATSSPLRKN